MRPLKINLPPILDLYYIYRLQMVCASTCVYSVDQEVLTRSFHTLLAMHGFPYKWNSDSSNTLEIGIGHLHSIYHMLRNPS